MLLPARVLLSMVVLLIVPHPGIPLDCANPFTVLLIVALHGSPFDLSTPWQFFWLYRFLSVLLIVAPAGISFDHAISRPSWAELIVLLPGCSFDYVSRFDRRIP